MSRIFVLPLLTLLSGCAVVPSPLEEAQLSALTLANRLAVDEVGAPIAGAISIHEAIARALKYNLDANVETFNAALRADEALFASAQMLPGFVANAGYSDRSNDLSSAKLDLPTGIEVPASSLSSERAFVNGDVTIAWNVLDFALGYVRARQAGDQHLRAKEARRRAIHKIIEDTRVAYWRSVGAERHMRRLTRIDERAKRALRGVRAAARAGAESPMTALAYERELTQIRQAAERIKHELVLAKSQLAALINIAPGTAFHLVDVIEQPDPVVPVALEDLFAEAVFNRPEVRDIAYKLRINEQEAAAAFLALLPSVSLSVGHGYNNDKFLLNHDWLTTGASAALNLLKIVELPARRASVEAEQDMLRTKALAVTASIMVQVVVSRIRQRNAAEQLATADEYREVQKQLVQLLQAEKDTGIIGEQTLIREEMNLLIAEVQRDLALGSVVSANANLMTTLGYDLPGIDIDLSQELQQVHAEVRARWTHRAEVSQRARYLSELERARREAERQRQEVERQRREEARKIAEAQRAAEKDARRLQRADNAAQRAEAEKVRKDARALKRKGVKRRPVAEPPKPSWTWTWPWDVPRQQDGMKDLVAAKPRNAGTYSGTK